MMSHIVPETPENPIRRRSSRRSTILATLATTSMMRQIAGTPDNESLTDARRTIVEESPFSTQGSQMGELSKKAADLNVDSTKKPKKVHPMFVRKPSLEKKDDSYEEFAPATQDPGSVTPTTKVLAWLDKGQESVSPMRKRRRQSGVKDMSEYLLNRSKSPENSNKKVPPVKTPSTIPRKRRTRSMLVTENSDHVPYRPPSFQDYSGDSAKALLANYENKGSLTPQVPVKDNADHPKNIRKTRSLEEPPTSSKSQTETVDEDKILDGVCAYVEVRSGNENRSDVVIDQLLALGASVVPKIGSKCTHIIFKEGSLATYNRAKKQGIFIVAVNWIEACKKAKSIVSEASYPPMNQEKYDSPGLFPKIRKAKSMQPKSDEEFAKLIEAKTKRIMKKKLADSPVIPGTPRSSPKIPKRRRSQILDTLKEYEDQEKESPATPGSPCSSEELNTPFLKRIAKRLFKANQENTPSPSTREKTPPPLDIEKEAEFEVSNDGFISTNSKVDVEKAPEVEKVLEAEETPEAKKTTTAAVLRQSSPKRRPRKSMNKSDDEQLVLKAKNFSRKKKLYTQNSVLSETPSASPAEELPCMTFPMKKAKTRTKIVKKGSIIIATQAKENIDPASSSKAPNDFIKPLPMQPKPTKKRIVRSLCRSRRSSMDFNPRKPLRKTTSVLPQKEFVLTSCSQDDQDLIREAVKKLPGKVSVVLQVRPTTTHVICGAERRTLNMLKAIIRGCWIVSKSWILASFEAGGWIDEEPYELVTFSAAVKARRLEREAELLPSKSELLSEVGSIWIGKQCRVPRKDLVELIQSAGGHVVNQMKMANVILGHDYVMNIGDDDVVQVQEKWILDSLQQHCPLPFVDYLTN